MDTALPSANSTLWAVPYQPGLVLLLLPNLLPGRTVSLQSTDGLFQVIQLPRKFISLNSLGISIAKRSEL